MSRRKYTKIKTLKTFAFLLEIGQRYPVLINIFCSIHRKSNDETKKMPFDVADEMCAILIATGSQPSRHDDCTLLLFGAALCWVVVATLQLTFLFACQSRVEWLAQLLMARSRIASGARGVCVCSAG